jgi:hypothetical protein
MRLEASSSRARTLTVLTLMAGLLAVVSPSVSWSNSEPNADSSSFREALKTCQRLEAEARQLDRLKKSGAEGVELSRAKAALTGARVQFFEFVETHENDWLPWQRELIEAWARDRTLSAEGREQWSAYLERRVRAPQPPGFWSFVEKVSGGTERKRIWKLAKMTLDFSSQEGRALASAKRLYFVDDPWNPTASKRDAVLERSLIADGSQLQLTPFPSVEAMAEELKRMLEMNPGEKVLATRGLASAAALQLFDNYPDAVQRFQIKAWVNVDGVPYGSAPKDTNHKSVRVSIAAELEQSKEDHYLRFSSGIPSIPGLRAINVVSADFSPENLLPEVPVYRSPKGSWMRAAIAGSNEMFR